MDPITVTAITAAIAAPIGAASTALWRQVAGRSTAWLSDRFRHHSEATQREAYQNALGMLQPLFGEIEKLRESTSPGDQRLHRIEAAFDSPGASSAFEDALISAAKTSDESRQRLLARAVFERLQRADQDITSFATELAISAIPHLSADHLRALGLITLVRGIRPGNWQTYLAEVRGSSSGKIPSPQAVWDCWLTDKTRHFEPFPELSPIHFAHLASLSCVENSVATRDIRNTFKPEPNFEWVSGQPDYWESDTGEALTRVWSGPLGHAQPTSTGNLIGIFVYDEYVGQPTNIAWS